MAVVTATYSCEWLPVSTWVDITSSVIEVSDGSSQLSSGGENPLAFGDSAESQCSVQVIDTLTAGADVTGRPIRVTFSINAVPVQTFVGLIQEQQEQSDSATVGFSCRGAAETIRATKAYSAAYYLRPVATKTTAVSVEDPANVAYVAGLMNYALWQAGGRPLDQLGTYPGAAFYYVLDQAMLAPSWSWLAGEDGWGELQKLAQAAGGQIYQDQAGVVRYKQPLNIVGNAATYTFDNTQYGSAARSRKRGQVATKVIVAFVPRQARPLQQIIDDTTIRLIHPGETLSFTLEPQWPLKSLECASGIINTASVTGSEQLLLGALVMSDLAGVTIAQGAGGYTHTLSIAAQRLTIAITNGAGRPLVLWRTTLRGEPITAGEAGNVTVGSGTVERQVAENPFIQSAGHATRIANLILTFYASARASVELDGCVFDVARYIGEVVNFTATRWSVSAVPHVIVKAAHDTTGAGASYTLAPVAGLPAATDYFLVSSSSYSGQSKKVAF